jgi:hypothetical protein
MAISREELETLMRLVGHTEPNEVNCEECLMKVSEFAEHQLRQEPILDDLRAVEQHLAICSECREEHALLLTALRELG